MAYSKSYQQTLSTEYQGLYFTKNTPLKSSNIESSWILNETHLDHHIRKSSMESIKSPTKSQYLPGNNCPQNKILRSHVSNSQFYFKDLILDDDMKRSAYLFFDKQKSKILATKRSCQYLLPKLCVKSKKAYQSKNNSISAYNENQWKNNKLSIKQKVEKKLIFKKCQMKINNVEKERKQDNNVAELTDKFRKKCEAELEKINFKIPEDLRREKCFFDLTQEEIQQFYLNPQPVKKVQQNDRNQGKNQGEKKDGKFKLIRIDSEGGEQNRSVPVFLIERLSAKDLFRGVNESFLTDLPRIQKKLVTRPKLRHIL